ncbi:MAG TPA: nidogen-like domain-containing protein [Solirubrobacteraceae bacterium]|nr:nidogen-like domain-containing protein [Solirubrobacteraceae bacterium]
MVDDPNCGTNTLAANDDGSTNEAPLPFTVNFFGNDYSSLWVNNNGNVTFTQPLSTYTPFEITSATPPIIAPFLADVDTRGGGSGLVTYGNTTFEGRPAFCVDWPFVGYYAEHNDKLNDFQMILVERGDVAPGDFDIVFNYGQIQWETGDASGGTGGFGGTAPAVGFSNGDGNPNHFFQLNGSLQNGAFLDSNPTTGLINNAYGNAALGRYVFHVTGGGGGSTGGISGLSRPWPGAGYGYSFQNQGVTDFEIPSGMSPSQVWTGLNQTFSDWGRNGADTSSLISQLNGGASGGLCFGLALSGARFDGGLDALSNPLEGRSDPIWGEAQNGTIGSAGTGPSASMNLPAPGAPSNSFNFNQQFLSLIADDWASQLATQVQTSLQLQHYAYADPTTGFGAFESQLQNVMQNGTNNYDPSGMLSSPSGNGFAMITLQTFNPSIGHEILAYSAESLPDGAVQLDVWDNNFPDQHYAIVVNPDLSWTYNAPYSNGDFQGNYSMSGAPGHTLGLLSILPLYNPSGLNFYPAANGGLGTGSLVDLAPGTTLSSATDSASNPVDVEPMLSNATVGDDGQIVDFPSDAGQVTLDGASPSLDVRGANTYMTLSSTAPANGLNVSEDEQGGSISATSNNVALTVGRGSQVAASNGAGGLTYGSDGTISTTNDSANTSVQVEFLHNGELATATLHSGSTTPGAGLTFSPTQVAAAEAAAGTATNTTTTTSNTTPLLPPPTTGSPSVGHVKVSASTVSEQVSCAGVSSSRCELTLTLAVKETLKGGKVVGVSASTKKRPKIVKRTVTVGSATVTLTGGQSQLVKVALNATGKRLLASHHKLAARLTTTQITGGHSTVVSRRTVTFKTPANRKHKTKG